MAKKQHKANLGVCKLTGLKGAFVDSHILPRALTLLSKTGERAIEKRLEGPIKKRFQGWYDNQLVIDEGEKILRDIDDKAIKALRKNHLVWSGWPTYQDRLAENQMYIPINDEGFGVRILKNIDSSALKLFFLSIVWRAAASTRDDMSDVILHHDLVERLRLAVASKNLLNSEEFPVRLHQIGNRGVPHNRTPIIEIQNFDLSPYAPREYLFCRIYLDGLIAHVALDGDNHYSEKLGKFLLGADKELGVFVNSFEKSRTFSNLKKVAKY
ncbi:MULTISPECIES: hypothetical protein [Pantoea]|uniref:hypothetical protein n=1 Tax=Pantoea TaxID=53335 RepID=UPI0028937DE0|nr:hypothetical protein [Pantoea sp. UBA5923]